MKSFLHIVGIGIVTFWLTMIGLLVKKVHFVQRGADPVQESFSKGIGSPQREWKEIYFKERKVGYAVNLLKPFSEGYFVQEEIFLKLNLMGLASGVRVITQSQVDQGFLLKSFNFTMASGVVSFRVSGRMEGKNLLVETGRGETRRTHRVALPGPPMVGPVMGYFFRSRKVQVGEKFRLPLFDPSTLAHHEAVIQVAAREPLEINRITYDAFRLETELWGTPMTFWIDEGGSTLKEEGFMGLTTVKSSAARAPRDLDATDGVADFYEMAAVKADKILARPGNLQFLRLRLEGLDRASLDWKLLNTGRQRFRTDILEITRERVPSGVPYRLPHSYPNELKPFLQPEFNMESDDPGIVEKASEIAGAEDRPVSVAGKLLHWVYHSLEKKPVVSVPSALEVLRSGAGDCNEHATLLTALLRASGIPARLCIGLVYTRDRFFYHAWTEAYLGEWVSMDATLNQMPADASHVKLVEGNLDKQVVLAGLIGTLSVKILDYRYD
jgi:hypothetical protein